MQALSRPPSPSLPSASKNHKHEHQCGKLRFLFIDETEATGADTIGELEHHVTFHISSKSKYKYALQSGKKDILPRPFGGVNVFFLGDFWQLRPTGQLAIMSNPYGSKVLDSSKANLIMSMFWKSGHRNSLQAWEDGARMLHLSVNERSGADVWFSNLLNSCRQGELREDDYNFLHGYPTKSKIDFWYAERSNPLWKHEDQNCHYQSYHVRSHWTQWPAEDYECRHCWLERKRRCRVLLLDATAAQTREREAYAAQARERLSLPYFADSILITQFNIAVFHFAQERALNFARSTNAPAFLDTGRRLSTQLVLQRIQQRGAAGSQEEVVGVPREEDGRCSVAASLLLRHAVESDALGRSRVQEIRSAQRISLQTESLGTRREGPGGAERPRR